jgi:glycosyltransferase involved in cell wall biosynthesis
MSVPGSCHSLYKTSKIENMNITIVCTHLGHARGGAEINDLHLGREFSQLNHDVTYTFQSDDNRDPIELDRNAKPVRCPYLYGISYNIPEPFGKVLRHLNQEYFVHQLKKQQAELLTNSDLVLTTGRPILSRLATDFDAPVFHAVRGSVNPLYHSYLERADGLVFWGGCEESYQDSDDFGTPYITLDPGVDTNLFYDYKESAGQERQEDEPIQLIFVGRLEPVKRVDRILQALELLQQKGKAVQLTVVGDGSQRTYLEELAENLGVRNSVEFTGRVPHDEIPEYLNASDIFVLSSRMENHPIALKEALACGVYVIGPDKGRISEMLENEEDGHLYIPDDGETLAAALEEIIESGTYESSGVTNQRAISGWRENAEAILQLYERVTSNRQSQVA